MRLTEWSGEQVPSGRKHVTVRGWHDRERSAITFKGSMIGSGVTIALKGSERHGRQARGHDDTARQAAGRYSAPAPYGACQGRSRSRERLLEKRTKPCDLGVIEVHVTNERAFGLA